MLSKFGRWALGLYPPSIPSDLRLTDIRPLDAGHSQIVPKVEIREEDRRRLRAYQQEQHAIRDELQALGLERETIELDRRP